MKLTEYKILNHRFASGTTFAVICDLHGVEPDATLDTLKKSRPDFILAPGDIFEPLDANHDFKNEKGYRLLRGAAHIAPTVYSPGNHEAGCIRSWLPGQKASRLQLGKFAQSELDQLGQTGAVFLDNSFTMLNGIAFGGLGSGLMNPDRKPDLSWLDSFTDCGMPKILLCHHPEYYGKYLRGYDIDLIVSGHAHGGQWRIFGRGVFAPGQGIFPKYTSGVHDNRFVISTGLRDGKPIPRFFNPPEIVLVKTVRNNRNSD